MKIYHHETGKVLYHCNNVDSFKELVEMAVKEGIDLSGGDFTGMDLEGANLQGGKFSGACFAQANMKDVNLILSDISYANMKDVYLENGDLQGANATGTDMENAKLMSAKFNRANMREVNLTNAYVGDTDFSNADMYGAILSGIRSNGGTCFYHANMIEIDTTYVDFGFSEIGGTVLAGFPLNDPLAVNFFRVTENGDIMCNDLVDGESRDKDSWSIIGHLNDLQHEEIEKDSQLEDDVYFQRDFGI